jgi:hypothetical protein
VLGVGFWVLVFANPTPDTYNQNLYFCTESNAIEKWV